MGGATPYSSFSPPQCPKCLHAFTCLFRFVPPFLCLADAYGLARGTGGFPNLKTPNPSAPLQLSYRKVSEAPLRTSTARIPRVSMEK